MIHAVMRPAAKFPDIVGNLDRKAVVQITRHHKNFLSHLFPFLDEYFPLVKKGGPCLFLIGRCFESPCTAVRNHEGHGRDHKKEISITLLHRFQ